MELPLLLRNSLNIVAFLLQQETGNPFPVLYNKLSTHCTHQPFPIFEFSGMFKEQEANSSIVHTTYGSMEEIPKSGSPGKLEERETHWDHKRNSDISLRENPMRTIKYRCTSCTCFILFGSKAKHGWISLILGWCGEPHTTRNKETVDQTQKSKNIPEKCNDNLLP